MISVSQQIPAIFDIKDEVSLRNFLIAVKLSVEEIVRKGQERQDEIRSSVPIAADIPEGKFVPYLSGAAYRIYTKQNGVVKYISLT